MKAPDAPRPKLVIPLNGPVRRIWPEKNANDGTSASTKVRGDRIERLARDWWLSEYPGISGKLVRVLAQNYRSRFGEIDLVVEETHPAAIRELAGGRAGVGSRVELVMIEVRARAKGSWVSGLESVTFPKQLRLRKVIEKFLARYQGKAQSVRCDVMEWDGEKLTHFPNAWRIQ